MTDFLVKFLTLRKVTQVETKPSGEDVKPWGRVRSDQDRRVKLPVNLLLD